MVIDMDESRIRTLEHVRQFLAGTPQVSFQPRAEDAERYRQIGKVVRRFSYGALGKADRGTILRYLQIITGYSPAQLKRRSRSRDTILQSANLRGLFFRWGSAGLRRQPPREYRR